MYQIMLQVNEAHMNTGWMKSQIQTAPRSAPAFDIFGPATASNKLLVQEQKALMCQLYQNGLFFEMHFHALSCMHLSMLRAAYLVVKHQGWTKNLRMIFTASMLQARAGDYANPGKG